MPATSAPDSQAASRATNALLLALLVVVDEDIDGRGMAVLPAEAVRVAPYNSSTGRVRAAARHCA